MKKYKVRMEVNGKESEKTVMAESPTEAIDRAEAMYSENYGTFYGTVIGEEDCPEAAEHEKVTRKGNKRKFIATVFERFSDTFEVWAENEKEARQIVEDGIPEDYCPSATGGGYGREITIDPDFSD